MAAILYEPVLFVHRADWNTDVVAGGCIAIGTPGSGTQGLMLDLLRDLGISDGVPPGTRLLEIGDERAAKALRAGEVGLLAAPEEFPSPHGVEAPLAAEARHFFERGPSFFYRWLPFHYAFAATRRAGSGSARSSSAWAKRSGRPGLHLATRPIFLTCASTTGCCSSASGKEPASAERFVANRPPASPLAPKGRPRHTRPP